MYIFKVNKAGDKLIVSFDTRIERSAFIDSLRNFPIKNENNEILTHYFFALLGDSTKNPFIDTKLGWTSDEIRRMRAYTTHANNVENKKFPYIVEICYPHRLESIVDITKLEGVNTTIETEENYFQKIDKELQENAREADKMLCEYIATAAMDTFKESKVEIRPHEQDKGFTLIFGTNADRAEVDQFIYFQSEKKGYLTTGELFHMLKRPNPFYDQVNLYGWTDKDLDEWYTFFEEKGSEHLYLIEFKPPIILNDQKPEGIDDGGERMAFDSGAIREPATGKGRFDLISPFGLQRIARWYELGSMKYSERNWEKGIPMSRCLDSALRHMNKFLMGMTDEDHLAAAAWNVIAIMHYEETGRNDLDDLPHFMKNLPESETRHLEIVDEIHDRPIRSEEDQNENNLEVSS